MSDFYMCSDCLEKIVNNVSQSEILLLDYMNQKKMFNAQLSSDALKLASEVKGMSRYKIDIALKRMEIVGFIDCVKFGSIKYYITKTGRTFIKMYKSYITESANEDDETIRKSPTKKGTKSK